MRKHVTILGYLYLALGVLGILAALTAFGVLTGAGILARDPEALGVLTLIGGVAGVILMVVSLPGIVVGLGLLLNWGGWVIILAVILSVLNIFNFPFGTALAAYTFWVAYRLSDTDQAVA